MRSLKKLKYLKKRYLKKNPLAAGIVAFILIFLVVVFASLGWYASELRPVSSSPQTKVFVIQKNSTLSEIANNLQKAKLVRNGWALETYVKLKSLGGKFQAGTYALSPSQDAKSIVATLTKGQFSAVLVTILPGKRVDQIRAELINKGFTPDDVDHALDPAQYSNLPVMAFKPSSVITLEGLLWPDSFQKDQTTVASDIIKQSLIEMGDHLTPDVQAAFASQGVTPYQGLVLSSIIEQEVSKPAEQTQVAQVFYSRLKKGINLGSDVTARYGAILAGLEPSLTYDSPYNTLLPKNTGLPRTPISTIEAGSLYAATHPANTSWLYFVAGDNGVTHFSTTFEQQQADTAKYCHKLCSN